MPGSSGAGEGSSGEGSSGESDVSESVGEGGCSTVDPPAEGFCVCEDCGPPAEADCPPLAIACVDGEVNASLLEDCLEPSADDPVALECVLEHLALTSPGDASVRWTVALGEEPAVSVYLSSSQILGSSSLVWSLATDPVSWTAAGVMGDEEMARWAEGCLALSSEEQPACLHALLERLEPKTCFDSVPELCA